MLAVSTLMEVAIFTLTFGKRNNKNSGDSNSNSNSSGTDNLSLEKTAFVLPTEGVSYRVTSSASGTGSECNSNSDRIFLAGSDGTVSELEYTAEQAGLSTFMSHLTSVGEYVNM